MFSEFFILQFFTVVILIFFFFFWDSFFLIINALSFLAVAALFAWLLDADIYINFLVIIDLGVFFILLGFLLNFISVFTLTRSFLRRRGFYFILLLGFSVLGYSGDSSTLPPLCSFLVLFYDWFSIFSLFYFTDLQLLSDIYFTFSGLEFLLMNFYLYTVIVCLYILRRCSYPHLYTNPTKTSLYCHSGLTVRGNFMRLQDLQAQALVRASVRAWSKN